MTEADFQIRPGEHPIVPIHEPEHLEGAVAAFVKVARAHGMIAG